jgi:hypothetical protein
VETPSLPSTNSQDSEPPLSEKDMSIAAPDFLDEDQQTIYRRAYSLYNHMFGGDTTGIEYTGLMGLDEASSLQYETVEINHDTYTKALGRYQRWEEFDAVIHSVFTDAFWNEKNITNSGDEIYLERDKNLYFMDLGRGSGYYYNENFPDEFVLLNKTDSEISFTLIGHYSSIYAREGETDEQCSKRRAQEYDYTIEFPMKLLRTEKGWRFDEFHSALAEEKDENGM